MNCNKELSLDDKGDLIKNSISLITVDSDLVTAPSEAVICLVRTSTNDGGIIFRTYPRLDFCSKKCLIAWFEGKYKHNE